MDNKACKFSYSDLDDNLIISCREENENVRERFTLGNFIFNLTGRGKIVGIQILNASEVFSDYTFMTSKDSLVSRKILKEKNIDYIYLTKYEDYIETLPYLPEDLELEKVYENANSEIWKVK